MEWTARRAIVTVDTLSRSVEYELNDILFEGLCILLGDISMHLAFPEDYPRLTCEIVSR